MTNKFVYKLGWIKSEKLSVAKSKWYCNVFCRSCVICHWFCWRSCWWERSWCYIQVTLRLKTTAGHTSLASPGVPSGKRSRCWPQSARRGVSRWLVGRSRQLLTGSSTRSKSWLNVSVHTHRHIFVIMYIFGRYVVNGTCTWDWSTGHWRTSTQYLYWYFKSLFTHLIDFRPKLNCSLLCFLWCVGRRGLLYLFILSGVFSIFHWGKAAK